MTSAPFALQTASHAASPFPVVRVLCAACLTAAVGVLGLLVGCGGSGSSAPVPERHDVAAAQLQTMMTDGQPLLLIDVRTAAEYAQGHLADAVNLPVDEVDDWAEALDQDARICCVCASGTRSRTAADALVAKGFARVYNLLGGMNAWPTARAGATPGD